MSEFRSIPEWVRTNAERTSDRLIFTYADEAGKTVSTLTCREVYSNALKIAYALVHEHGLKRGDRAVLVYPPGLEFVEAMVACLLVGIVPAPVSPPWPLRPEAGLPGYTGIALDCRAAAQLTCRRYSRTRTFGRVLGALGNAPKWPDLPWIVTDPPGAKELDPSEIVYPAPTDIAFLQYTSGSTRAARGVCVTFENIHHQTVLTREELGLGRPDSVALFWMPHFHDFAMIGGIFNALVGNHHYVSFSAAGFLRRPALWGELIHRFRATHIGAPDFGYWLFARNTTDEQRSGWDFRPLVAAICAAEPIRIRTIDAFTLAFAKSGMKPGAFCPSYGLAEHTVAVTLFGKKRFRKKLDGRKDEVELIGCGRIAPSVHLEIVDPAAGVAVPRGESGEVWVDSASKAAGYFDQPENSAGKFRARLEGSDREWLRTGDLGLILGAPGGEELVILGRMDDMITFRGRNLYPQDAEMIVAESDNRVRAGRVIAFGVPAVEEDENQFVILIELKEGADGEEDMRQVSQAARALLLQELGLPHPTLVYVPRGTIPKTSSGKLQRSKAKKEWQSGKMTVLRTDRGLS